MEAKALMLAGVEDIHLAALEELGSARKLFKSTCCYNKREVRQAKAPRCALPCASIHIKDAVFAHCPWKYIHLSHFM
jgi:hypothetical protein